MLIRLDKFLTNLGIETRSGAKALIKKGRVQVDGQICKKAETKVDPEVSKVLLDGELISYAAYEYLLLNRPAGVISATEDSRETTVIDLLEGIHRKDLFPVGRLDKDTVGLLLLTNDGQLSHRLLSPAHHVDKCYLAHLKNDVTAEDIKAFEEGLDIGDEKMTLPAVLRTCGDDNKKVLVTITEGRFHQIKRMFEARDNEVVYLKRLSMGPLTLDEGLEEGAYRPLSAEEIRALKEV